MNKNCVIDGMSFYLPKNVIAEGKSELIKNLPESVRACARDLQNVGHWRFYVVDQTRGFCDYSHKVITVPKWAIDKGTDYKTWYLSHEIAHAHAGRDAMHGPLFMQKLIEVCPENVIHHELGYKPRNAAQAGISQKMCFDGF